MVREFQNKNYWALILGGSSGLGLATAKKLANKFSLILCGRRQEKLTTLSKSLSNLTTVKTLTFDVRDKDDVSNKLNELEGEWKNIDILINNAGNAHGMDFIHEGDIEDWDMMIDTNVKGLLYMTRLISPGMVKRRSGHIINICSTAGHEVYPNGNVYCATKHAVAALTKGMRLDLTQYGIKVSQISPGAVEETEFALNRFDGDVEKALLADPTKKAAPPENPMSADRVKWEHIHRVFELCNRNVSETARRLKMHRRTLQRILSKRSPR